MFHTQVEVLPSELGDKGGDMRTLMVQHEEPVSVLQCSHQFDSLYERFAAGQLGAG